MSAAHVVIWVISWAFFACLVAGTVVVLWRAYIESRDPIWDGRQPWEDWSHWEDDVLVIDDEPCCEPDYSYDLGRYVHTGPNCRSADYEYLKREREQ